MITMTDDRMMITNTAYATDTTESFLFPWSRHLELNENDVM